MWNVPILAEIANAQVTEPESSNIPEKVYSEKPMNFGEKLIFSILQQTEFELSDKEFDREIEQDTNGYTQKYLVICNEIGFLKKKYTVLEELLHYNIKTRLGITTNPVISFKPGYIIGFAHGEKPCDKGPCGKCEYTRVCIADRDQ